MSRRAPVLLTTGTTLLLGSAAVVLRWVGSRLPRPDGLSTDALAAWYQHVEPAHAAAATTWLLAVGLTAWLLVALVLQVVAAAPGGRVLRTLADSISPRSLQRLGHGLAGLSLTAGLAAAPSAGIPPSERPDPQEVGVEATTPDPLDATSPGTATMTRLDPPTTEAPLTTLAPSTTDPRGLSPTSVPSTAVPRTTTPVAEPGRPSRETSTPTGQDPRPPVEGHGDPPSTELPPAPPATPVTPQPRPETAEPGPRSTSAAAAAAEETIVVEPGMSFWAIAEEVLADDGARPEERAVARYWFELIEANRDRLVATGNPDLLLPGQVLVLPRR